MKKTTIGEKIDGFITYKRSLGYVYDTPERYLKHYQRHMEEQYPHLDLPDKKSTDCFLSKYKEQTGGLYNAMATLREFSRYLFQLGYMDAYLVPPKQIPKLHISSQKTNFSVSSENVIPTMPKIPDHVHVVS